MKHTEIIIDNSESNFPKDKSDKNTGNIYFLAIPLLLLIFAGIGFKDNIIKNYTENHKIEYYETKGGEIKNSGKFNILSSEDLTFNLKDTVYTNKDTWLELKINEQTLYQHWRDGTTKKFPISSGNNKGSDPESLESRPGLFAIFVKVEHHQSSQFNAANMYHFMPFNQGIGFHSIDGTGYYANLGVRPSSHGCIRMKHSDAEKLFEETPLGTLVLAMKGYSARTVAFAPKDFVNEKDYDKAEYKKMLANNLYNILKGRYYIEERERFIIDPKIIPVSGVYTSYDVQVPDKQIIPRGYVKFIDKTDQVNIKINKEILLSDSSEEMLKLVSNQEDTEIKKAHSKSVNSTDDLVREYFNNPIGVLPYFGPKK